MQVKYAVISDLHLVQQNIPNYDNLIDFRNLLEQIKKEGCRAIFIAGDFFDEKISARKNLLHPEGESKMLRVRKIIREFEIPIFCLKGNHDTKSVLLTTEQALSVDRFQYISNSWKEFEQLDAFFLDSQVDEYSNRDKYNEVLAETFKNIISIGMKKKSKNRILLMHENIATRQLSLSKEVLTLLSDKFDLVLNGHEHIFVKKPLGVKSLINLPPALPSLLQIGKFWIAKFERKSSEQTEPVRTTREGGSPFGFLTLQATDSNVEYEFRPFIPSITPIFYSFTIEKLDFMKIMEIFREDINQIKNLYKGSQSIILPEMQGEITFHKDNISTDFESFQREFNDNNTECYLDELRTAKILSESDITLVEPLPKSDLSVKGIGMIIKRDLEKWIMKVQEKNENFTLSSEDCKRIFNEVYPQIENLVKERGKKADYLTNFINTIRELLPFHEYSDKKSELQIKELYYDIFGAKE